MTIGLLACRPFRTPGNSDPWIRGLAVDFPGISLLGCVGHNGFRMLRWFYSKEDVGDPAVTAMKLEHRSFIRLALTGFYSYIVIMPVQLGL